jgi:hypothetical protein
MRNLFLPCFLVLFISCTVSYDAKENLGDEAYTKEIIKIAPYVVKKPDEFGYEDRFKKENQPFYTKFIQLTNGKISYYLENDTATLFFFEYKDLSSLYEHYRGLGGYYKKNDNGDIHFMNLLYHAPRLTRSEMDERGKLLFTEMAKRGNVDKFIGDKNYIDTPNADFFYNTKTNRWDYTENSSWKFLEEAKQAADSASLN